jgi:hypothetical protein
MTIFAGVGGPQAFSSASGGKVYAYNTITNTAPTTVAPANPSRSKIRFHNPGTVDVYIGPAAAFISASAASPTTLTPTTAAVGGCFLVFANGGTLDIAGECQQAWQALAKSGGATNSLTVMDSNI